MHYPTLQQELPWEPYKTLRATFPTLLGAPAAAGLDMDVVVLEQPLAHRARVVHLQPAGARVGKREDRVLSLFFAAPSALPIFRVENRQRRLYLLRPCRKNVVLYLLNI